MDGIWVLLTLAAAGVFLLGIVAAIYLVIRFLIWVSGGRGRQPTAVQPARGTAVGVAVAAPAGRAETLDLLEREARRAWANGQLSSTAWQEFQKYLNDQRALPVAETSTAPAPVTAASTAPTPPPLAAPPPPPTRDGATIRAAIAKLHEHAQAPDKPEIAASPAATSAAPAVSPADAAAPSSAGVTLAASAQGPVAAPPGEARVTPLPEEAGAVAPVVFAARAPEAPGEPALPSPAAQRLFTPENVRILQSLGIGLIFLSAVAFVRTSMWEHASAGMRLLILGAGTFLCVGLGFALRRWTSLRITALAFLILGHLALVLDAWCALSQSGPGRPALYPWSPSSLWCLTLALFTASSLWHGYALEEPLFAAFTLFGGLATWGAGLFWFDVSPPLLAAAYVPALILANILSRVMPGPAATPPEALPAGDLAALGRWSLRWWLRCTWEFGACLLVLVLPIAALCSDRDTLREQSLYHAAAMVLLALGLWEAACRRGAQHLAHAGALLLLFLGPLGIVAYDWELTDAHAAFSVPGALMALAGLLIWMAMRRTGLTSNEVRTGPPVLVPALMGWGLVALSVGVFWALWPVLEHTGDRELPVWTLGLGLCVSVAFALEKDSRAGAWAAMFCAVLLLVVVEQQSKGRAECFSLSAAGLALAAWALWECWARSVERRFGPARTTVDGPELGAATRAAPTASAESEKDELKEGVHAVVSPRFAAGLAVARHGATTALLVALLASAVGAYAVVVHGVLIWFTSAWGSVRPYPLTVLAGVWLGLSVVAWLLAWWSREKTGPVLAAGLAVALAAWNGVVAAGWLPQRCGPVLVGVAILLFSARELQRFFDTEESVPPSPWKGKVGGLLWALLCAGCAGVLVSCAGAIVSAMFLWEACAGCGLGALLCGALAVIARRGALDAAPSGSAAAAASRSVLPKAPSSGWVGTGPAVGFLLETVAWVLLVIALVAGAKAYGLALADPVWVLVGAVFLVIGMAGESLAGAALGAERHKASPTPFLESRFLAATGCAAWAVVAAWGAFPNSGAAPGTWAQLAKCLLGVGVLGIYGGFAQWSYRRGMTVSCRALAGGLTYFLLLPGGWLAFLSSQSTGSSYAALWFLLAAPLLLLVAYVLEQERTAALFGHGAADAPGETPAFWDAPLLMQAAWALGGVELVSVGALILSFAANRGELAAVPAVTFAAVAALLFLVRAWKGWTACSVLLCLSTAGAVWFGSRAGAGCSLWQAWTWEFPVVSGFGLLLVILGGLLKLEADRDGRSRVSICGWGVSFFAVIGVLIWLGVRDSVVGEGVQHVHAACLTWLGFAAASFAMRMLLGLGGGVVVGVVALLIAFYQLIWAHGFTAWEFYTLPTALALYAGAAWTSRQESGGSAGGGTASPLVWVASFLAIAPSLLLALPRTPEATHHFVVLMSAGVVLVLGALWARRKAPLLMGSGGLVLVLAIKAIQWAHHRELLLPVGGAAAGLLVLSLGCLFESRMNKAVRGAVDRAKAQAQMFWVSWH